MPAQIVVHRFTVGNQRYIGLELPEAAKRHEADSPFVRHWRSVYASVLSQARSGIRSDSRLLPGVARELAEVYARKTDSGIHERIDFHKTRSGNVLLRFALNPKETDYPLNDLSGILAEHSATFGQSVSSRYHGRGKRP